MTVKNNMPKLGIYVHIPFCMQKCNYCDFYSLGCNELKIPDYVSAVCKHIEIEAPKYKDYEIDTVFFGGGTPSLIEPNDFERLTNQIKSSFKVTQNAEFSIEANPGTLTLEKLNCYKKCGVNRLSIGLQSTNDSYLRTLGRIHTLKDFKDSYFLARKCGFDNINIDIMYGLPNQKAEDLEKTIEEVCEFNPEHISAYCLKIEENTPFYKLRQTLKLPNDDEESQMYLALCAQLEKNGYFQYEISNFSKKGLRCLHNLKYWLSEEYIGFGPSAHSYFQGKRYYYENNLENYINSLERVYNLPEKIYEDDFELSTNSMDEYVMLKMRLSDGVNENEFLEKFGVSFISEYPDILSFVNGDFVKHDNAAFCFTPKGFFVSNYILSQILKFN